MLYSDNKRKEYEVYNSYFDDIERYVKQGYSSTDGMPEFMETDLMIKKLSVDEIDVLVKSRINEDMGTLSKLDKLECDDKYGIDAATVMAEQRLLVGVAMNFADNFDIYVKLLSALFVHKYHSNIMFAIKQVYDNFSSSSEVTLIEILKKLKENKEHYDYFYNLVAAERYEEPITKEKVSEAYGYFLAMKCIRRKIAIKKIMQMREQLISNSTMEAVC